jgi:hypothetical protein
MPYNGVQCNGHTAINKLLNKNNKNVYFIVEKCVCVQEGIPWDATIMF